MNPRLTLALLFACLSVCHAGPQRRTLPDGYPPDGAKKDFDMPINMGSGVHFSWSLVREDDTKIPIGSCVRECQGQKHEKHETCDLSCDNACPSKAGEKGDHYDSVGPTMSDLGNTGNDPPATSHEKTLDKAYEHFQFPSVWRAADAMKKLRASITGQRGYETYTLKHWNETPCSTSTRLAIAATYVVTVQYVLYDDTRDAQGKVVRLEGPKGTFRFRLKMPLPNETVAGEPEVNCRCEVKQTGPSDGHGFIPGRTGEHYAYFEEGGMKRPLTGNDVSTLVTSVTVNDMNSANMTYMAPTTGNLFIPAGWEFECIEGGGQGVQLADDLYFAAEEGTGVIFLRLSPPGSPWQSKKLRVFCTEIDKPEPRPGMKYRLVPPRNAQLQRAAQVTKASNFRGPWDQMRLWIATDRATYEKIASVLVPTPSEASYIAEMHKLANVGAIDPYDDRILALMDLSLLFAPNQELVAAQWVLLARLRADADKTIAELKSLGPEAEKPFTQGDQSQAAALFGALVSTLVDGAGDKGTEAALWLVQTVTPIAHRKSVADAAGAALSVVLSSTSDANLATRILEWIEAQRPVCATLGLASISSALPETLRTRAKTLCDELYQRKRA